MTLNEMRQRRAALINEQRAYLDTHTDFTAEDQAYVSAMDAEIDGLENRIATEERVSARMADLASTAGTQVEAPAAGPVNPLATPEYTNAFWNAVRGNITPEVRNALTVGTDASGGFTVPVTYEQRLIAAVLDKNPIRQFATVRSTSNEGKIPTLATRPSFALVAEGGTYAESEPTYGQIAYDAYKFGGIIKVAEELMQDSMFDLESHIAELYSDAAATVEGGYFTTGSGSNQPQGFITGGTSAFTSASATAVTADELIDLQGSVKAPYQANARWAFEMATWTAIRKLKDSTSGAYLLVPGLRDGESDMLLGKPIMLCEDMESIAATKKAIAYGDFKHFNILDRSGVAIQRLNELYAGTGHVGFRCFFRTDSKLEVAEAVKYITQKA